MFLILPRVNIVNKRAINHTIFLRK